MGLDMYLSRTEYLSQWTHSKGSIEYAKGRQVLATMGATREIPSSVWEGKTHTEGSVEVKWTVAKWRKSNQIHSWFVRNVQGGVDECQESEVSLEQLQTLVATCKRVIKTEDPTALLPEEGFFFGGTEIDKWYWEDLRNTIEQLEPIIKRALKVKEDSDNSFGSFFIYQASW